jgi:Protein of unknown function (DUF4232)
MMTGLRDLRLYCARGGAALMLLACTPDATAQPGPAPPPSPGATRQCSADDLDLSARWQRATGALAGGLRLEVTAATSCALPAQLQIALVDAQGQGMLVDEVAAPTLCDDTQSSNGCLSQPTVEVEPGHSALVRFIWRNWCGPPPSGSVGLEVTLADEPALLSAPIVDVAGTLSTDTPRCDAPDAPSTLAVGPVQKPYDG